MKWLALMEVVSRAASPIVTIILARFLVPEDFGVVATAMIVISFAQMFFDAGLSKALIQTDELTTETGNIVFWSNTALGLMVYPLLFLAAPWISRFFDSPDSGLVLRVLGLQIMITSLASVQHALIVRDLDFRRLFRIRLVTSLVPATVSIPMAYFGWGVWALVTGSLLGQLLNLLMLWRSSTWRPGFHYNVDLARRLFRFGFWALMESLAAWLLVWGDTLIVGRFLGVRDLGVYQTGWMLVSVCFGIALNPILPVLFPAFSRMQDDPDGLKRTFHRVNRTVLALSLPIGVGLFLTGPEIAAVLFGDRWHGLGLVLQMLGITLGLAWPVGINAELYRAIGRPDIGAKLLFVSTLLYMPAYLVAAQINLEVFLYVRFGLVFAGLAIHSYVYHRSFRGSFWYLWNDGRRMIMVALFMACGTGLLKYGLHSVSPPLPTWVTLCLVILCGVGIYSGGLWWAERSFVVQTLDLLKRSART